MLQRRTVEVLHGDEGVSILLANVVNGADVGMIERRSSFPFTSEAAQRLRVVGHIVRQELQRDKATEIEILGLVHHTHPSAAQFLEDAIMRDGLADHLGLEVWLKS